MVDRTGFKVQDSGFMVQGPGIEILIQGTHHLELHLGIGGVVPPTPRAASARCRCLCEGERFTHPAQF